MSVVIVLSEDRKSYVTRGNTYDYRSALKEAGFRYDGGGGWRTKVEYADLSAIDGVAGITLAPDVAARRGVSEAQVAENKAAKAAAKEKEEFERVWRLARSAAATPSEGFSVPAPEGLSYFPYQLAGIEYALRCTNTLIGDDMGVGKTIQAIGFLNALGVSTPWKRVLVVVPASLKRNWQRELQKWLVGGKRVVIARDKDRTDRKTKAVIPAFPSAAEADVVVLSYEQAAKKFAAEIKAEAWDVMIADESHKLKNYKAQRTISILGGWDKAKRERIPGIAAARKIFLSGTPITNKAVDIQTVAANISREEFGSPFRFRDDYCVLDKYGSIVRGKNLDRLQTLLRSTGMVRRMKKDVLADLPSKTRRMIPLDGDYREQIAAEKAAIEAYQQEKARKAAEKAAAEAAAKVGKPVAVPAQEDREDQTRCHLAEIQRARLATARAKIPACIEHIREAIEDEGVEKIIVFAQHKEIVDLLVDGLRSLKPVRYTGDESEEQRDAAAQQFQNDADCRVFVGTIGAAGVGLTLTAASHVVFVEGDWTPANLQQAEDRAHRIGQKSAVTIQHLIVEGSIDADLIETILGKIGEISMALDEDRLNPEEGFEPDAFFASNSSTTVELEVAA